MTDERTRRVNTFNGLEALYTRLARHNGEEGEVTRKGQVLMPTGHGRIPGFDPDTHYYGKFRVVVTPDEVQIQFPAGRKTVMVEVAF